MKGKWVGGYLRCTLADDLALLRNLAKIDLLKSVEI